MFFKKERKIEDTKIKKYSNILDQSLIKSTKNN